MAEHLSAILTGRACVVREKRGNGYPYWRLYVEAGSGQGRTRLRVYVGTEGGPELRRAIRDARRAFWGQHGYAAGLRRDVIRELEREAKGTRGAARKARAIALSQVGRRLHGQVVRARRDIPAVGRYRAEYRSVSLKLLEEATWAGISETQYTALRRAVDRLHRRA
ncbi:MAG: hypothetical protein WBF17_28720 [Phycisphaerae bacterium]